MADIERLMISVIIMDGDLHSATKAGVRVNWFEDPENNRVFKWILNHDSRYGKVPTRGTLRHEYPNYRILRISEPYEYYVERLRRKRTRALLVDAINEANTRLEDDDTVAAQRGLNGALEKIGLESSTLVDLDATHKTSLRDRYIAHNKARKQRGKLSGIPTGFFLFDYVSGGYHDEQFILFGGAPKQCKSYLILLSAMAAQDAGKKVLFVTFEMSVKEQLARYDAICAGIPVNHVLREKLDDEEMKKLKHGYLARQNLEPFVITQDRQRTASVMMLAGKLAEHKPDILFIDGVYHLDNDIGAEPETPRAFTAISRALKRLAQSAGIPVVGTTQSLLSKMKSGTVTMHSLGWTSAWAQDADVILGVEKIEEANLVRLRGVAGREISPFESNIHCNWDESLFQETEMVEEGPDGEDNDGVG